MMDTTQAGGEGRRPLPEAGLRPRTIALLLVAALLLAATVVAFRKDIREGFDEVAHLSYVADLQDLPSAWPRLDALRLRDPASFALTAEPSYINHPPPYYLLLAVLGPPITDHPSALPWHRLLNVVLAALGFAALVWLVGAAALSPLQTLVLIAPLVMVPVLPAIVGAVNNDNAAFTAGALALCGVHGLLQRGGGGRWLSLTLAGLVVAGMAKLNALLLVGGLVGLVLLYLLWRGRLRRAWLAPIGLAALVAAAPYLAFIATYGSPAPHSAGQQVMLETLSRELGWFDAPRLTLPRYVAYFVVATLERWAPALQAARLGWIGLSVPLFALACALAGAGVALQRLVAGRETAREVVVIAGWAALAVTVIIHVAFSYQRHLATGWLLDTYPRYYIALFPLLPLSALVLLSAMTAARARAVVAALLTLSPLALNLAGALIG